MEQLHRLTQKFFLSHSTKFLLQPGVESLKSQLIWPHEQLQTQYFQPDRHWQSSSTQEDRGAIPHSHSHSPAWPLEKSKDIGRLWLMSSNCSSFSRSNQCQHEPNASVWIPSMFKCSSFPHPWHLGMHNRCYPTHLRMEMLPLWNKQNCQINSLH